jgi:hypothetical protein
LFSRVCFLDAPENLKDGSVCYDLAHKIMAPEDKGACAVRGPALELAFDATTGAYLSYIEDAMSFLDQKRAEGKILGGWFSLRFVGPSRAILSPQQSARTCMIELVGLRSMRGINEILNGLELLGKSHGAIQHWGMHSKDNLLPSDLQRAYPRLDTWRRVRREITNNGTIQTFENDFTHGWLDAAPEYHSFNRWVALVQQMPRYGLRRHHPSMPT